MNIKNIYNKILCVWSALFFVCISSFFINAGLPGTTLVNTLDNGPVPIQYLKIGDQVVCLKDTFQCTTKPIIAFHVTKVDRLVKIIAHNHNNLCVSPYTKFFLKNENKWCVAEQLKAGQLLLKQNMEQLFIQSIEVVDETTNVFDITVKKYHNFGITPHGLVVHNMATGIITVLIEYLKKDPIKAIAGITQAACFVVDKIKSKQEGKEDNKQNSSQEWQSHLSRPYKTIQEIEPLLKSSEETIYLERVPKENKAHETRNNGSSVLLDQGPSLVPRESSSHDTKSSTTDSLISGIGGLLQYIPLKILNEMCNGSENRKKAHDKQRRINEERNRKLYPNPSPDIVFDYGVDYTNCKYKPDFQPYIEDYKPAPLDINLLNSNVEYEASCERYLVRKTFQLHPSPVSTDVDPKNEDVKDDAKPSSEIEGKNNDCQKKSSGNEKELDSKTTKRLGVLLGHLNFDNNFDKDLSVKDLKGGFGPLKMGNFQFPLKNNEIQKPEDIKEFEKEIALVQEQSKAMNRSETVVDNIILVSDTISSIRRIVTTVSDLRDWYNGESGDLFKREEKKKPQKKTELLKNLTGGPCPCLCGCPCKPGSSCGCFCGCGKFIGRNINKNQKKLENEKDRKKNVIHCSEFFNSIKNDYENMGNGIYALKNNGKPIEGAHYLHWDYLHGEVEAYSKGEKHLGALDPKTKKLYKSPVLGRKFPE